MADDRKPRIAGPFMLTSVFVCAVIVALAQAPWAHRSPALLFTWVALAVMGPLVEAWHLEQLLPSSCRRPLSIA